MIATLSLLWALCMGAFAAEVAVVRANESLEDLAARVGRPGQADAIRAANGVAPDTTPPVGTPLALPAGAEHVDRDAVALSVFGDATRSLPGGAPEGLGANDPLPPGSVVCTGEDSYVTVRLSGEVGGSTHDDVSLLPETCLVIEATAASELGRSSLIRLEQGSITVQPGDDGATPGLVAVRTRDGVSASEGGGFRVHREDEASRTEALTSPLRLFGAGDELALEAGQGARVREGEAPGPPVWLPKPGAPTLPGPGGLLRRPDFAWTGVDRAIAFRVQVSISPDFRELVLMEEVGATRWEPAFLLLPSHQDRLWWRVISVDRLGFLGLPSAPRLVTLPPGVTP